MTEGEKEDDLPVHEHVTSVEEVTESRVEEAPSLPLPPPDLTERLNKHLLTSFLDRLNTGQVNKFVVYPPISVKCKILIDHFLKSY